MHLLNEILIGQVLSFIIDMFNFVKITLNINLFVLILEFLNHVSQNNFTFYDVWDPAGLMPLGKIALARVKICLRVKICSACGLYENALFYFFYGIAHTVRSPAPNRPHVPRKPPEPLALHSEILRHSAAPPSIDSRHQKFYFTRLTLETITSTYFGDMRNVQHSMSRFKQDSYLMQF